MAKLDRPLYGDYATGTFARSLAFRHTANPPDLPGATAIFWGTVTKLPGSKCSPSPGQHLQRHRFSAAVAAWRALSDSEKLSWKINKPPGCSGFNFFVMLYLLPELAYFYRAVYGLSFFQVADFPDQLLESDYIQYFPSTIDEVPEPQDNIDSPQAWLFNRIYATIQIIQEFLILNRSTIEGGD